LRRHCFWFIKILITVFDDGLYAYFAVQSDLI